MPRSRTRAWIRAARLAAGLIPHQPEWTPGRIGHLLRKIWKRFAALEDRRTGRNGNVDRRERRLAIKGAMDKWGATCVAESRASKAD
jgi:hypothetical protein